MNSLPVAPCYGFIMLDPTRTKTIVVTTPLGHAGFPKGKREKGEDPWQCAVRELYEETGLTGVLYQNNPVVVERTEKNNISTCYFCCIIEPSDSLHCQDHDELLTVEWMDIKVVLQKTNLLERRKTLLQEALNAM